MKRDCPVITHADSQKLNPFHTNKPLRPSLFAVAAALLTLFFAVSAEATVTTLSFQPNPVDLNDLDHHMVYTWRIDNITVGGQAITGTALSITNVSNWESNPNVLHLHFPDTAISPGVASFADDPSGSVPVPDLTDDFTTSRYHGDPNWLLKAGTSDMFLADPSLTTSGINHTLNFTTSQLQALSTSVGNGNEIAFGPDRNCHFFNDGIKFTMNLAPVPEMAAFYPIIGLLAAVTLTEVLRRRRLEQLTALVVIERD